MQKFFYLLIFFTFSCVLKGFSQESSNQFQGWIDTVFPLLENRQFDKATELSESVKKLYVGKSDSKDLAFANLIIAKMYQLRARLDVSEESLIDARKIITNHHPENDSLQFFLLRYEADQLMYQYKLTEADSLLVLAELRGEKAFGKNNFQMALYYSSKQVLNGISGNYYKSLEAAKKALEVAYIVLDSLSPSMAGFENNVGIGYVHLDKLKMANTHYKKAMKILMANSGEKDIAITQILNNIGSVENSLGNYQNGLEYVQRGIDLYNSFDTEEYNDIIIDLYYNGAYSYVRLGDYNRSEKYIQQAERYLNENVPKYKAYLSAISLDMSMYARKGGDFKKAQEKGLLALEQQKEAYGETSDELIFPLSQLAYNSFDQNNIEQAIAYFEECISLLEINDRLISENAGDFYDWLGEAYENLEEFPEALKNYEKALEIYNEVYGPKNFASALILSSMGACYNKMKNYDKGRAFLDRAWQNSIEEEKNFNLGKVPSYDQLNPHIYIRDLVQDECQYNYLLNLKTDRIEYLLQGLKAAFLADKWIDKRRYGYTSFESSADLLSNNFHLYEWGMIFSKKIFEINNNSTYLDTAFYFAEKSKSASLFEAIKDVEIKNSSKIPSSIIDALNNYEIDINNLNTQISDEKSYGEEADSDKVDDWSKRLFNMTEGYEKIKAETKMLHSEYFELRYNTAVVELDQLQTAIPPKTTMLEYMVGDSSIHIFIIDQNNFNHFSIEKKIDISNIISRLNISITDRNTILTNQISDSLYHYIFEPIEKYIAYENLVIIPEGPLHYLNFEVLKNKESGDFLIHSYNISYENSASYYYLKRSSGQSVKKEKIHGWLGFAPGFDDDMKEAYKSTFPKEEWDEDYLNLIRQPNSKLLISNISKKQSNARSFVGIEANEANLLGSIKGFATIHFSTHAEINDLAPNRSHLVLAKPEDPKSKQDGYLDIAEIFTLPIQSNLVVLTACNTGLGKLYRGEGMVSLARGFQFAGAKNIIMSLWSVDEQQSNVLMDAFYDEYDEGKSVAKSLRSAKLKYLKANNGELGQPYYWAGLVAIGPDVVSNQISLWGNWWMWGVAILIIVLLLKSVLKRKKKG